MSPTGISRRLAIASAAALAAPFVHVQGRPGARVKGKYMGFAGLRLPETWDDLFATAPTFRTRNSCLPGRPAVMDAIGCKHARFQKFMREVFETIAYNKTTDAEATRRLADEGNALLRRMH